MKVLVGSENPVKIKATEEAFSIFFENVEVVGLKVNSGVPDQPINQQTFEGAKNRALKLYELNKEENLGADFFVGIEGGIAQINSKWFGFGAVCIMDKERREGFGLSPHFELPERIVKELLNGKELGEVMAKLSGETNIKRKIGAVGFLTKGKLPRKDLYKSAVITALIPFLNKELFR